MEKNYKYAQKSPNIKQILTINGDGNIFSVSPEYEKNLLKKRDSYRNETKTDKALKIVIISAENIAGKANMEHITRVLTLDDLFI